MALKRTLKKSSDPAPLSESTEPVQTSVGEILREEFMKPLRLTAREIAKAIPQRVHPEGLDLGKGYWERQIKILIGEELDDLFEWQGPSYQLYAALDKYFGLPNGYFIRLWAVLAGRAIAINHKPWLRRIKPHRQARRFAALEGSCPDLNDYLPATTGSRILRGVEIDAVKEVRAPSAAKKLMRELGRAVEHLPSAVVKGSIDRPWLSPCTKASKPSDLAGS